MSLGNYSDFDADVLAICRQGDFFVTFVTAESTAINGESYDIVSWDFANVCVAVSYDYLNNDIENYVSDNLSVLYEREDVLNDYIGVVESARILFVSKLQDILIELFEKYQTYPFDRNIDLTIERILKES